MKLIEEELSDMVRKDLEPEIQPVSLSCSRACYVCKNIYRFKATGSDSIWHLASSASSRYWSRTSTKSSKDIKEILTRRLLRRSRIASAASLLIGNGACTCW